MTMNIRVLVLTMNYQAVCEWYNANKEKHWNPLERLNRAEGGFQIKLNDPVCCCIPESNPNNYIKQLRWSNRRLIIPTGMYGFNSMELELLFKAMINIYGEDNIFLEKDEYIPKTTVPVNINVPGTSIRIASVTRL